MKLIATDLPGCLVFEPRIFEDARGTFYETFNLDRLGEHGLAVEFRQGNVSRSNRGVIRGLHYQWPTPQGKLVSVIRGEILDVAVDIRRGSPTFGRAATVLLSEDNRRQMWIPEGFAHGFAALSQQAVVAYLCTQTYDPAAEATICWDDPQLAIDWPISNPTLSAKDAAAPLLSDMDPERLPVYRQ